MQESSKSEARERVLTAAERLFGERGYNAVSLRDIAAEVGIKHTSLYHHVPKGKEELYIEVTERRMERYQSGLQITIHLAGSLWLAQLHAAARWLLAQPPMHFGRMMQSDMQAISPEAAERLRIVVYRALLSPLESVLTNALAEQSPSKQRVSILAGMFLSLIEGISNLPDHFIRGSRDELLNVMIDLFVNGIKPQK